jgi:hypothetical protein
LKVGFNASPAGEPSAWAKDGRGRNCDRRAHGAAISTVEVQDAGPGVGDGKAAIGQFGNVPCIADVRALVFGQAGLIRHKVDGFILRGCGRSQKQP